MIIYPEDWKKNYEDLTYPSIDTVRLTTVLRIILTELNVRHLAYSGGVDSTILLCLMKNIFGNVHTYTISSREDHPDVQFARKGSLLYNSTHHEFIVNPTHCESDIFTGDNAVRQLFENVSAHTDELVCCDGIDEFVCGYYDHQDLTLETYTYYLSRLLPDHLIVLDSNSKNVKVSLPYLDKRLVDILRAVPLNAKVSKEARKLIMTSIAKHLNIPDEFIYRNKYGFCDAFIEKDKKT